MRQDGGGAPRENTWSSPTKSNRPRRTPSPSPAARSSMATNELRRAAEAARRSVGSVEADGGHRNRDVDSVISAYERGGTERVRHDARATTHERRQSSTARMQRCRPIRRGTAHSAGDHRRRRTTTTIRSGSCDEPRRNTSSCVLHLRSEMLRSSCLREGIYQSTIRSDFLLYILPHSRVRRTCSRLQEPAARVRAWPARRRAASVPPLGSVGRPRIRRAALSLLPTTSTAAPRSCATTS